MTIDECEEVKLEGVKGCPFCGKPPSYIESHDGPTWGLYCITQSCPANVGVCGNGLEDTIQKWNTRAGDKNTQKPKRKVVQFRFNPTSDDCYSFARYTVLYDDGCMYAQSNISEGWQKIKLPDDEDENTRN